MDETEHGPRDASLPSAVFGAGAIEYLCAVPADLGAVTRLKTIHGRVVAETASGIPMIVPCRAALI